MNYSKQKNTKRFEFQIDRNTTAKRAGSNILTISSRPSDDGQYSVSQTSLTMTVKEAQVLNSFLNESLSAE